MFPSHGGMLLMTASVQAKKYLITALTSTARDVDTVAANIQQCVEIESSAIDALAADMSFVQQYVDPRFYDY